MKCISSLISPITLIVYIFFVLFEIFFVLISANCIIAHTAVCTGCFSYKSCMDKLHSGIVGIAHCRHHFRQIMFPCKIRNRTFCKFIIDGSSFLYGATFISKSSHLSHFFLDKAKDQYISFLYIGLLQSTNFKFLNADKNKLPSISSISARDVFSLYTT